ncbi:MAG: hypothetical protein DKM50_08225 [Candidatus Margulisiibacteriota bacterium]|nr:MAG: hypothetical protein A2X43_03005 [Candidatus Margulisbacteria bacterium GWD2_39_127]OGI02620.1 MAG: hypothetical protein A2X42_10960 [Candidatus Margulisbacteria bacterium GWF2_38_17]OGI10771.1 MAG: hypothetical protein A2X41_10445 [Candidatus Margulisbacteria bacterium GWE2_39_32]PZM79581.1 MAG: hypothetical protein DKM50_08225 [Candidatus Margulisiibacteriota bacterium]HAR63237.1 hypothetical protein [Candidatus Margulisiibacteriota bacterium]
MNFEVEFFIAAYTQSFGRDGAEKIINDALSVLKLTESQLSEENALKLCDYFKAQSGTVRTIANLLASRILLRKFM